MQDKKIIYQVLPRLWGSGRFSDWHEPAFAYLRTLGVDYVWFTGIPRHATGKDFVKGNPGCPYAVTDWFDVNPYLAVNPGSRIDEFKAMVARAHASGLKCLIDFIPNHVAADYEGPLPIFSWHDADWTDTRKVNWNDPRTPLVMLDILRFWAAAGVDGFRCDMVELVPSDALGHVIKSLRPEFPGLMFVAEVYGRENYSRYLDAGFDLLYDKSGAYDILRGVMQYGMSARELTWNWQFLGDRQPRMLNFLENHDEQRVTSDFFLGDGRKAMAPLTVSLLFNTAPFMIYFGQEYGERGMQEEGYSGRDGRTSIFDYCSLSGEKDEELYTRYKELTALAASPLFAEGKTYDLMWLNPASDHFDPARQFAFMRGHDGKGALVVANFADHPVNVRLNITQDAFNYLDIPVDHHFFEPIDIPAGDAVVIKTFNV